MFNDTQLDLLLHGQAVEANLPFQFDDDESVQHFYQPLLKRIERIRNLSSCVEWGHYGSGYDSYVDAWFYPRDDSSRISGPRQQHSHHYTGLIMLLSRLSRFFVIGQGEQSWSNDSGGSYSPCFDIVDQITHPALVAHVEPISSLLTEAGLVRLRKNQLIEFLPSGLIPPTILTNPPYRHFDALFHWED
jgi:hypothetical protein